MGRMRALLVAIVSGALTLAALTLMPDLGDGRQLGWAAALFFGACTLVAASNLVPAKIPDPAADGSITINNSPLRALALAIALIAVTAACVLMLQHGNADNDWRWYVFVIIPAPCIIYALIFLRQVVDPQPAYRFDRNGVTRFNWGERTLRWADVVAVRRVSTRGAVSIVLDLTPEARGQSGALSRMNAAVGYGDMALSPGATGLTPDEIESLVERFRSAR